MRGRAISFVVAGLLVAACGDSSEDRIATGGLGGAAAGALVGGPVGAIVGGGVGVAGGAALDESVDEKVSDWANMPDSRQTASASGSADRGRVLGTDAVHRKLHNEGYVKVYQVRREGAVYLARGEREGRAYDIRTDAYTGRIIGSSDVGIALGRAARSKSTPSDLMSEQQVRDSLRRDGYEILGPLDDRGKNYRTHVRRNDEVYSVTVDRRSARIIHATPESSTSVQGAAAIRQGN